MLKSVRGDGGRREDSVLVIPAIGQVASTGQWCRGERWLVKKRIPENGDTSISPWLDCGKKTR